MQVDLSEMWRERGHNLVQDIDLVMPYLLKIILVEIFF